MKVETILLLSASGVLGALDVDLGSTGEINGGEGKVGPQIVLVLTPSVPSQTRSKRQPDRSSTTSYPTTMATRRARHRASCPRLRWEESTTGGSRARVRSPISRVPN